jgi:hypothetical protein
LLLWLYRGEGARWLRGKLARRGRLPRLESSSHTGLPQGFFYLPTPILSSFAGIMPRNPGLGGGSGLQTIGDHWHLHSGLITAGKTLLKSSCPCCPESCACPARRSNFPQVGSGHKQCTVRWERIIPPAQVALI